MDNFDLRKFLAEGKLYEGVASTEEAMDKSSTKMKMSELKAKIRTEILAELTLNEDDDIDFGIGGEETQADVDFYEGLEEATKDGDGKVPSKDADTDIDIEDKEEVEVDVEEKPKVSGVDGEFLDQLEDLKDEADAMGDNKLERQIDNTITYFTRQHIAKDTNESLELEEAYDELEENLTKDQIQKKYNEMFGKNPQTKFADVAKALNTTEQEIAAALFSLPMFETDELEEADDMALVADLEAELKEGYESLNEDLTSALTALIISIIAIPAIPITGALLMGLIDYLFNDLPDQRAEAKSLRLYKGPDKQEKVLTLAKEIESKLSPGKKKYLKTLVNRVGAAKLEDKAREYRELDRYAQSQKLDENLTTDIEAALKDLPIPSNEIEEGYSEFQRADKGKKKTVARNKGEKEVYGAGVKKGEEIEKEKLGESLEILKMKNLTPAEIAVVDDLTESINEGSIDLSKVKNYAKKGLMTLGVIATLLGGANLTLQQKQDVVDTVKTEIPSQNQQDLKYMSDAYTAHSLYLTNKADIEKLAQTNSDVDLLIKDSNFQNFDKLDRVQDKITLGRSNQDAIKVIKAEYNLQEKLNESLTFPLWNKIK